MRVPAYSGLAAWAQEISRQRQLMRPASPLYRRFDETARQLTADRIRAERDADMLEQLARELRAARYPAGWSLHDLNRVWTREQLGALISAAEGRARQLRLGYVDPRAKGPTLDPRLLPDHRLEALIQRHRDLETVELLRAERSRRRTATIQLELF